MPGVRRFCQGRGAGRAALAGSLLRPAARQAGSPLPTSFARLQLGWPRRHPQLWQSHGSQPGAWVLCVGGSSDFFTVHTDTSARRGSHRRTYVYLAACFAAIPTLIYLLKTSSIRSCNICL